MLANGGPFVKTVPAPIPEFPAPTPIPLPLTLVATKCYHVATMPEVSVRELKNRLTHYLRRLELGERFTVTRRGKPVATITPIVEEDRLRRKLLELRERGIISWSGGKPQGLPRPVKLKGKGPTISEMVLEDRR